MKLPTPSQTIGPFFRFGLSGLERRHLVASDAPGAVALHGRVLDGDGAPVPDAMVEICQPEGYGRCLTDDDGRYRFVTVKPDGDYQAPHLDVSVFARGLLQRLVTRVYFPDEPAHNEVDPLLATVTEQDRATTLLAVPDGDGLRFDIRLQGEGETVFLAW